MISVKFAFPISESMIVENYTVEVTGLSPNASDKEVYEFFSYCGEIEHLEIIRLSDYVSFSLRYI
nr:binding partner of ACD11 1-like isoform X1 [Ipomoea batatas]